MNQSASSELTVAIGSDRKVEKRWVAMILSTRRLMISVFMLLIFILAARAIVDPDFWWHLKAGQYILKTGTIPRVDIFSHGHFGKEWVAHEWLSEVLISWIYDVLGFRGLVVTFSIIVTATLWIVYKRISRAVSHPLILGFALLLGALASAPTWGVRPQMFSFLFAATALFLLESYAQDTRSWKILWLVPLMVLWVNMHAGFGIMLVFILLMSLGLFLEGILDTERKWKTIWQDLFPLGAVWLFCLLAVMVNPNGPRMYSYPFETLTSPAMMKYIAEWRTPDFQQPMFQPLALLLFAVSCSMALSGRRVRVRDLLFLTATGWGTLRSARNVPFFVLIAVPLLAEHSWYWISSQPWAQWLNAPEQREVGAKASLKVALNILLLLAIPAMLVVQRVNRSVASQSAVTEQVFPVAAAEHMLSHKLPQPIYNEYGWGGYLIWRLYPQYRVHIDGRADLYGDAFLEQFLKTHAGEANWQQSLNEHNIKTVVIRSDAPLANLLRSKPEWKTIFQDSQAVIFIRNQPTAY